MTRTPDPATGPPSGRVAQAPEPGEPATHLPPRVAGGKKSPQLSRERAAEGMIPSPVTGAPLPSLGTAPARGRTQSPAGSGPGDCGTGRVGSADPAGAMREPGVTVIPGPGPYLHNVSDGDALFMLRRELWDLPVIARFTIDGEPVSKSRARFTKRGSKTQAYTPEKTHDAEQVVGWQFRRVAPGHKLDPEKTYGVIALFFCGTRQRRDVDNMLKLILDGLNQIAWPDDEQVTEVSAKKTLTLPENARTEVAVYQIGTVSRFTAKCAHCGRDFPIFKSTSGRQKYCSRDCASAARRQSPLRQMTCDGCGSLFTGDAKRRFCTYECRNVNGRTAVTCTGCGTEFTKQKCHVRAVNYCTDKCRDSANREHRQRQARGTCETCGTPTSKKTYRQCNACRMAGTSVTGRPRAVAS